MNSRSDLLGSPPARPLGVTLVGVLLFVSGAAGIIGGVLGLIAGTQDTSAVVEGTELNGIGVTILAIVLLAVGVLNIVFAFGVFRGSRLARMIVTIVQVITIVSGIAGFFVPGASILHGVSNLILPTLIIGLLWTGAGTREFFTKR